MLPTANTSEESIIVLLDWFSGHLTDEVAATVSGKGHVLLFHGGGTTPFTQINDTHLHARVAQNLIQLENAFAQAKRRSDKDAGIDRIPSPT